MNLELAYWSDWDYEPQAVSLTNRILKTYKQRIKGLKLIPAGGGRFELTVDGELLYSKLKSGKFPDEQWIIDAIAGKSKK